MARFSKSNLIMVNFRLTFCLSIKVFLKNYDRNNNITIGDCLTENPLCLHVNFSTYFEVS